MIKRNSVLSVLMIAATLATAQLASADLKLNKNDHIAIIGNSLPDRMQHDAWLETYLQAANPDKQQIGRAHV